MCFKGLVSTGLRAMLLLGTCGILPIPLHADNKAACGVSYVEVERARLLASASSWANMRGSAGSLAAESKRLFEMIGVSGKDAERALPDCPVGCPAGKVSYLFSSVPHSFLEDYDEHDYCAGLLSRTTATPLVFSGKSFSSLDELNEWFSEFSQGDGGDGEKLYEECDSSCSPQYFNTINKEQTGAYVVNSKVICGHARDKDDNQYELRLVVQRECL